MSLNITWKGILLLVTESCVSLLAYYLLQRLNMYKTILKFVEQDEILLQKVRVGNDDH